MERSDLDGLSREELIGRAEAIGVPRPRVLTQPELIEELVARGLGEGDGQERKRRGWFGKARDLLAGVVERGLHLPDVAKVLRTQPVAAEWPAPPPPLPTVTLAEIYAAQGHVDRALGVLGEILARSPSHAEALALRARLTEQGKRGRRAAGAEELAEAGAAGGGGDMNSGDTGGAGEAGGAGGGDSGDGKKRKGKATESERRPPTAETSGEAAGPAGGAKSRAKASSAPASEASAAAGEEARRAPEKPIAKPTTEAPEEGEGPSAEPAEAKETEARAEAPLELPDHYDVDEVVALAVDPRTLYVYWEVRPSTLASARADAPDGALVARILSVLASWEGPLVQTRDVRVDALVGDAFIGDITPGANLRVSVGWLAGDRFFPLAVGLELTAPHDAPGEAPALELARWSPAGAQPLVAAASSPGASRPTNGASRAPVVGRPAPLDLPDLPDARGPVDGPAAPRADGPIALPAKLVRRRIVPGRGGASELVYEEITEYEHAFESPSFEFSYEVPPWSRGGASEQARGGASERLRGGASERLRGGASERLRGGASERLRGGASENLLDPKSEAAPLGAPPIRFRS